MRCPKCGTENKPSFFKYLFFRRTHTCPSCGESHRVIAKNQFVEDSSTWSVVLWLAALVFFPPISIYVSDFSIFPPHYQEDIAFGILLFLWVFLFLLWRLVWYFFTDFEPEEKEVKKC